ncbi:MAG: hypothetical protein IPL62_19790 [Caulobacteraceae bacterium]|nr:hypothetical protein [Caulobacteraceae bacterium]
MAFAAWAEIEARVSPGAVVVDAGAGDEMDLLIAAELRGAIDSRVRCGLIDAGNEVRLGQIAGEHAFGGDCD